MLLGSNEKNHDRRVKAAREAWIQYPVVRQYLHNGVLYREAHTRDPSRFELFFDLLFVGIIKKFGTVVEVDFSGVNLAAFILLLYPAWSIWQETRNFVNVCGTDDFAQRLQILFIMALLVGYTVNAGSIHTDEISEGTTAETPNQLNLDTLQATIAFFAVCRAIRLFTSFSYAALLPRFRTSFLTQAGAQLVSIAIYLPLIWINRNQTVFWILASAGMAFEVLGRYAIALIPTPEYAPCINAEHFIERVNLFVIIALGEVVLNIFYVASREESSVGLTNNYWKSLCGLIIVFSICWIYFDSDNSSKFVHAMRRNYISALTVSNIHFPLVASIILVGASYVLLMEITDLSTEFSNTGLRWFFGESCAVIALCLAIIGAFHKTLDRHGSALIRPNLVHLMRAIVALIFALLPLTGTLDTSLKMLAIYAGIWAALVVFETTASLGSEPAREDELHPSVFPVAPEGKEHEKWHRMSPMERLHACLTGAERGEEDAGGEDGIGQYRVHPTTEKGALAAARIS